MTTPPQPPVTPGYGEPYTLGNLMPAPTPPAPPAASAAAGMPAGRIAAWITAAAGAAMILGSFLPWVSITVPIAGTQTASGVDGTDGWVTAAVGLFVAAAAVAALRGLLTGLTDTLANAAAALGGLGVAGLSIWKVVDLQSKVEELRAEIVADGDEFGFAERLANAVSAQVGIGLWLLIGAGLATAVCAAYVALARR